MPKITFMGAGSTVFAKNVLGDSMLTPSLAESEIALSDIDPDRLKESENMLAAINKWAGGKAHISSYLGVANRKAALKGANYVINAIQVGGYEPCTVTDFEIPKRFGLQQTIGDTLGIGGIFRALRTIPVMREFARDIEAVCPDCWFLNYTNPMAMLSGFMQRYTGVRTVGLCHSVQVCAKSIMEQVGMEYDDRVQWKIAGINHQAWLLEITRDGKDLYPEIKRRALEVNKEKNWNMVRLEIMRRFGYYVTESSEHSSEYTPWFIKDKYPQNIEKWNIPLDEYPRRCIHQIERWKTLREELTTKDELEHTRTNEYASRIMNAMETNEAFKLGGNVLNTGLITNLPQNACVEVPCIADKSGVTPTYVGPLPEQCAALNRTNINVQLLTIEAAVTHKKDCIYQAALMDPHTSSELDIDDTVALCDALIEAHGDWLEKYE